MELLVPKLGGYLKEARTKAQLTMRQVCEATNLSPGYISRIENNSSIPSIDTLQSLCLLYDLDIKTLVRDENLEPCIEMQDLNDMFNKVVHLGDYTLTTMDKRCIITFVEWVLSPSKDMEKPSYIKILKEIGSLKRMPIFEED